MNHLIMDQTNSNFTIKEENAAALLLLGVTVLLSNEHSRPTCQEVEKSELLGEEK